MNLNELRKEASFHERLLMDATIKAYKEMMKDRENQAVQKTAKDIARELDAILTAHIFPNLGSGLYHPALDLKNHYRKAMEEFRSKYDIE